MNRGWIGAGGNRATRFLLREGLPLHSMPGDLREIGTCRACGMLISRNEQGTWSHGASVGEMGAAEVWLGRH